MTAMNRMQFECWITHDEKDSSPNTAAETKLEELARLENGTNTLQVLAPPPQQSLEL